MKSIIDETGKEIHINDFVSGRIATDHNDVIFMGLIIASFWAFVNYVSTEKKFKYVILIGVFCGAGILGFKNNFNKK